MGNIRRGLMGWLGNDDRSDYCLSTDALDTMSTHCSNLVSSAVQLEEDVSVVED